MTLNHNIMTFENLNTAIQYYDKVFPILDSKLENNLLNQLSETDLKGVIESLNNLSAIGKLHPNEKWWKNTMYIIAYKMYIHILLGDFIESAKDCSELLEITENNIRRDDRFYRILFPELLENERMNAIRLKRLIEKLHSSQGETEILFELRLLRLKLETNPNIANDILFLCDYIKNQKDSDLLLAKHPIIFLLNHGKHRTQKDALISQLKKYTTQNNYVASYFLGAYYEENEFREENLEQSRKYYAKSAKSGFILAMLKMIGYHQAMGNLSECFFWRFKVLEIEGDHCKMIWDEIERFLSKNCLFGLIDNLIPCAKKDSIIAQFLLYQYYKKKNPQKAIYWFEKLNTHNNFKTCIKREYESMKTCIPFEINLNF